MGTVAARQPTSAVRGGPPHKENMDMPPLPARIIATICIICTLCLPVTTQAQTFFGDVTIRDEIEMGKKFDRTLRKQLPMVEDPVVENYVTKLVDRLVKAKKPMPFTITTAVVRNPAMNAFAVPGGYVYVFTGLLAGLDHESELASVLAHELAHVSLRHVAKRIEAMQGVNLAAMAGAVAGMLLGVTGGGNNSAALGSGLLMASQGAAGSAYLSYTRESEREADHIGLNTLTGAGYRPSAMPDTFQTMLEKNKHRINDTIPAYKTTHPGLDDRMVYLTDRIARMPDALVHRSDDDREFLKIRALALGRYTEAPIALAHYEDIPPTSRSCWDWMGMGIAYQRQKRPAKADESFQQALECNAHDPLILREAGIQAFQHGDFNQAGQLLQKAVVLNPKDAVALYFVGRLLGEKGEYASAVRTMQQVLKIIPEDADVHQHLGRLLGQKGELFEAHLHLAYASFYDHDEKGRAFHLRKAEGLASGEQQRQELKKLKETIEGPKESPSDSDGG